MDSPSLVPKADDKVDEPTFVLPPRPTVVLPNHPHKKIIEALELVHLPSPVPDPKPLHVSHVLGPIADRAVLHARNLDKKMPLLSLPPSNALKFNLAHKEAEISRLRGALFASNVASVQCSKLISDLKHALKSVAGFAAHADEYLESESSGLMQTINDLNAFINGILNQIVTISNDKARLAQEIPPLQRSIQQKQESLNRKDKEISQMKEKLHQTYKEYLDLHAANKKLTSETIHGSMEANAHIETLNGQIQSLSVRHENVLNDVLVAREKTAKLEFEIAAVIKQFNEVGDEKTRVAEKLSRVEALLTKTEAERARLAALLDTANSDLNAVKQKLSTNEFKLADVTRSTTSELNKLTTRINTLTGNCDSLKSQLAQQKQNLDNAVSQNSETLKINAKLVQENEKIKNTAEQNVEIRDNQIVELTESGKDLKQDLEKMTMQKERTLIQLNETRHVLESERLRLSVCQSELQTFRQSVPQLKAEFEKTVQTLTSAKKALSNENRDLNTTVSTLKASLALKTVDCQNLEAQSDKILKAKKMEVAVLQEKMENLTSQNNSFQQNIQSLDQNLNITKQKLEEISEKYQNQCEELTFKTESLVEKENLMKNLQSKIITLEKENLNLKVTLKDTIETHKDEISALQHINSNLRSEIQVHKPALEFKDKIIEDLKQKLASMKDQFESLRIINNQNIKEHDSTRKELLHALATLSKETMGISLLENAFNDSLKKYNQERRARLELDALLSKRAKESEEEEEDPEDQFDEAFDQLSEWVRREILRVEQVVGIMKTGEKMQDVKTKPRQKGQRPKLATVAESVLKMKNEIKF